MTRAAFLGRLGALILAPRLTPSRSPRALEHPDPRPGITAENIPANETLGTKDSAILASFDAARAHPEIFDGLACACGCTGAHGTHRSFLTCYETRQAAGCHGCEEEGELVTKLINDGKSLAEIRRAVDKLR
jgi:hypothetical protein